MATQPLCRVALATFISLVLWIVLMIWHQVGLGEITDQTQLIQSTAELSVSHYLNYLNAVALTILDAALLFGLYLYLKKVIPGIGLVAVSVLPVYATLNVFAYGAQITVLPVLAHALAAQPENPVYPILIAEVVHYGSGIVPTLNGYAYALLAVPCVILGIPMLRKGRLGVGTGVFFILSAIAGVLGFIGNIAGIAILTKGVLAGGILWIVGVFILWRYLSKERSMGRD